MQQDHHLSSTSFPSAADDMYYQQDEVHFAWTGASSGHNDLLNQGMNPNIATPQAYIPFDNTRASSGSTIPYPSSIETQPQATDGRLTQPSPSLVRLNESPTDLGTTAASTLLRVFQSSAEPPAGTSYVTRGSVSF